ncbi:MAG: PD-(D/E)XK nuclease family protein [Candidatus Tectomicrobia bacterium]|nr:PD-(D/E)XK nuclease family protein [Candidatus Tectomicrobia bacterium]
MPNEFAALLKAFRQAPPPSVRRPTFMEVAGYPYYENVCSNILAFFLYPTHPHKLGMLFLEALARVADIQDLEGMSNSQVEREVRTEAGNSIDILIESDSHAVLVENKIFAGVNNPLAEYAAFLEAKEQAHKHKLLLTLEPTDAGTEHGFENITYEKLLNEIRALLGRYAGNADSGYLTFLLDFLNTLDNLQGGEVMNAEFVDFLAANFTEAKEFFGTIRAFKEELRGKVDTLANHIPDYPDTARVRRSKWREPDGLRDVLVHDVRPDPQAFPIAVDTIINPMGWEIEIFARARGNQNARETLGRLLQHLGIQYEMRDQRHLLPDRFAYAAPLEPVAERVREVVHALANSGNAWQQV